MTGLSPAAAGAQGSFVSIQIDCEARRPAAKGRGRLSAAPQHKPEQRIHPSAWCRWTCCSPSVLSKSLPAVQCFLIWSLAMCRAHNAAACQDKAKFCPCYLLAILASRTSVLLAAVKLLLWISHFLPVSGAYFCPVLEVWYH